jgi:hypothetical protein
MQAQEPEQSEQPKQPKPFHWGKPWQMPSELRLPLREVEKVGHLVPYLMTPQEYEKVLVKAEDLCTRSDPTSGSQLSVVLWAKKCLDKRHLLPISHEREWVLRIKRAGRLAFKMMREAGDHPVQYFPNKLPEYERAFAD